MLSLLRMRLHEALRDQRTLTDGEAAERVPTATLERSHLDHIVQAIPIKRVKQAIPFVYGCAIAHHLATQSQPAAIIATELVDTMLQQTGLQQMGQRDAFTADIVPQATATGLIQFKLGERAIAAWLDLLVANALPTMPIATTEPLPLPDAAIFAVQYAHARCCSLLRLAHKEALITLDQHDEAPLYWRVISPSSLPWLTSTNQLCLNHAADRTLLGHLVEARDCMATDSPRRTQRTLRSAQAIAQAMQVFHSVHPLWRKTGRNDETGTIGLVAQLGLLLATQRILYILLAKGLDRHPAVEL